MRSLVRLLFVLSLSLFALTACGSEESPDPDPTSEASSDSDASASPEAADGACSYIPDGEAAKDAEFPPEEPVSAEAMTISTNRGDIKVALDAENTPCAVNSFVSLAGQGYFDDTQCHRLVPGFVLQCGDPSATGMGGPGYRFADELTGDETYTAGTLAMANAGPDTNGSQFFIMLEDGGLPPAYTVFGSVDAAGLQVARDIEADGNGPDGVAPASEVVITSVS
ncbi:MAG: peptidylprolyl isomerase [Aeromicrobium sp.]|uniref:peptidylprolyl isomerase n=1 Tax=Aeromicrobium sp. TaxID=1871063 RepID=UPI0039E2DE93